MTPASPETHLIGNHASLYLTWNRNRHFSAFSVQQQYLVFMFQRTAFNSRKPVFGCTWYQEHDKMKQKPTSIRCHFTIHSYGPYRKTRGIIIYSGSHSPQNMNQMLIYSGEKKKKKNQKTHHTYIQTQWKGYFECSVAEYKNYKHWTRLHRYLVHCSGICTINNRFEVNSG